MKYFISFENLRAPIKILGYRPFEKINLYKNIVLHYFK